MEWLLEHNKTLRNDLQNPVMCWNTNKPDMISELAVAFADIFERDYKVVTAIRNELIVKCKHPKNMRDKADGIWYCMNCNTDL